MAASQFSKLASVAGLSATVALSGCSATPPPLASNSTKYPIYEMRSATVRPIYPVGDHNIAWIDDGRVLFEGLDRNLTDPVERNRGVPVAMRSLYVWNVRTNEVTRHTREALRSWLCFADGYVAYAVYRNGKTVWLEGPLGEEKEVEPLTAARDGQFKGRGLNPFTCRSYDRATLPKPKIGGGIEPLRPEHGWLEYAGNSTWLRTVDGKLVQISYEGRPLRISAPQKYSAYLGKYVYWRASQDATWLIEPTGTLEPLSPSSGASNEGRLEPAGKGKTLRRLVRLNVRSNWDPGESGLYVYGPDGNPERVISGLIDAMQVHSNGCSVAAIVDPWDREGRQHQLRAVNICQ